MKFVKFSELPQTFLADCDGFIGFLNWRIEPMCVVSQLPPAKVKGRGVIRFSVPFVYNLHEALLPLSSIRQGETWGQHVFTLFNAENQLDQFLNKSLWQHCLRVCIQPGRDLLDKIRDVASGELSSDSELEYWKVMAMQQQLASFKAVMEAEFMTTASFLVIPKRGYDIATLIEAAEIIFPNSLIQKVPEVLFDLREAGKCIAFDLGTAAGFHLLRALETVIRAYWNAVMEGVPLPTNRNLGNYINEMEKAGKGRGKVLTALRQIKDHHRNELMHPEEKLDLDEAIALLGIVQSAIIPMLAAIPAPEQRESEGDILPALPSP